MPDAHRDEIAKLEALYQENPEGRIFTPLAEALRKAGDLDRAHEVLAEGISRHPDYSSAHVVLGRVLRDQDRTEEADAEFRRVLELDPHNLIATRALGDLARARGDDAQALEYYNRLLDQEPSDDEVRELVEELTRGVDAPAETAEWSPEGAEQPSDEWAPEPEEPALEAYAFEEYGSEEEAEDVAASPDAELEAGAVESEPASEPEPEGEAEPDDVGGWQSTVEEPEPEDAGWLGGPVEEPSEAEVEPMEPAEPEPAESGAGAAGPESEEGDPWAFAPTEEESAAPSPEPEEDTEVRTETIAQVYARQGLYDRAAEVYRELLRRRPDDEALRERLTEMEQLAEAQEDLDTEVAALYGLEEEGEPEPLPELEPSGQTDAGVEEPGETDYGLEGFQPGELETQGVEPEVLDGLEPEETDLETGLAAGSGAEPEEDLSGRLGVSDVPEPPEESPWAESSGADEEADAEADEAGSVWTGDWTGEAEEDATPYAWADDEESEDASEPIRSYFQELLEWDGDGAAGADAASDSESADGESADSTASAPGLETHDATALSEEAEPGDAEPEDAEPVAGRPEAAEAGDDDDLEMFRSWLESLKQ